MIDIIAMTLIRTMFCGLIFYPIFSLGQQGIEPDSSLATQDTSIYTILPTMAEFGDNNSSMQKYITEESNYPATEARTVTSKSVFVQIIIEKDGSVTFDKIARGYNEKYDVEAKRIIENMPKWKCGRLNDGNPARLKMLIPIWFI